jgi:serine/threonine protein kinase/protein-disulfide isomerase
MPLAAGQVLANRYRIATLLGQGGFGAVYKAWDIKLNGPCAIKENFDTSPEAEKQFAREASILFNLRHPNLPMVYDYFSVPGQGQYLGMVYIEGEDLQQLLDRQQGSLPEAQVLPWMRQVGEALSYLHSQQPPVIHRDIKPANIKITPQGQAVLVDFGIAKIYDPQLRTTVGARAVTPGYSPPEQYGRGSTDARSDLYALGATVYALLTGAEPPDSVDLVAGAKTAGRISSLNPQVSAAVDEAVSRAMQLDREQRFPTVADFSKALLSVPATVKAVSQAATVPGAALPQQPAPPQQQVAPPKQQVTPPQQQLAPPKQQLAPPKQQLAPPKQQLAIRQPRAKPGKRRQGLKSWQGFAAILLLVVVSGALALLLEPSRAWLLDVYSSFLEESEPAAVLEEAGFPPPEREVQPPPGEMLEAPPEKGRRYEVPVEEDPAFGPRQAPVTVVEFGDFGCEGCRAWHFETWPRLLETYGERMQFIFVDFPQESVHPQAFSAALAANCAMEQARYWEYHDRLFSWEHELGAPGYFLYAESLGFDMVAFRQCLETERFHGEVVQDIEVARQLGVEITPTFFINGLRIDGPAPFEVFRELIERELAGK